MEPALPIDRMLPLEPIDRMLPEQPMQPMLAKLNMLKKLSALNRLFQLRMVRLSRSTNFRSRKRGGGRRRAGLSRASAKAEGRSQLINFDHRTFTLRRVSIDAQVQDQLERLGVPFEIFPCDPALADTANFCAAYGFDPADSANTILVIGKSDPPVYAACVVLSNTRLDVNKTVRNRLGTRKASFAPAEETRAITGMEIGGVTVFGLPPDLPIWVDERVMGRERIVLGGGSRSTKVLAAPEILLKLPRAEVVPGLANDA